ncbi:MAG TPA: hypothetical protein VL307_12850 [Chitinophagaceae bacterium]|nr:hypothetical protein [Chitinophagaceae bacterium]
MKIAADKWKHFYVGIAMGVVLQGAASWLLPGRLYLATTLAFVVVVGISYGFELFSKFTGKGHYEVMDAVAAIIGGVIGMAGAWGLLLLGHG